jgi:hypothetical protein
LRGEGRNDSLPLAYEGCECRELAGRDVLGYFLPPRQKWLRKNEAQALVRFVRAAYAGDAEAMYEVSSLYEKGKGGLPVDVAQAVTWHCRVPEVHHAATAARRSEIDRMFDRPAESAHWGLVALGIDPKRACGK